MPVLLNCICASQARDTPAWVPAWRSQRGGCPFRHPRAGSVPRPPVPACPCPPPPSVQLPPEERQVVEAFAVDMYAATLEDLSLRGTVSNGYEGDHELVAGGYCQVLPGVVAGAAKGRAA